MVIARRSSIPGTLILSEGVPVSEDDIADEAAATLKEVRQALDTFIDQKMIAKDDNGSYYIVHWDDRQYDSDSSKDRTRKYRASQKQKNTVTSSVAKPEYETSQKRHSDNERNVTETSQACHGDLLEAEADTDTDLELSSSTSTTRTREEVCKLFQQEIGVMSPSMRDKVHSAIDDYSPDWTYYAIERAVLQGKRSMAYILAVLSGWKTDGFDTGQTPWEEKRRHAQSGGTTVATASSGTPSPDQAWREVSQNLDPCKMPKWSHDKIADAVKAVGYPLLYGPSDLSVKKAAFIKAYGGG
jgi:DnaD/phage-associated family protein